VLLEAFLLGCATRKTRRVCQAAFGSDISPQAISNLVHELDDEVSVFHHRPLSDSYRFLYLDGLWLTVRHPRKIKKVLLVALGVRSDGSYEVVNFQLARSESAACWWGFISDLKQRGLSGRSLEVIVTDGAGGLLSALDAHYPRVPRQRCVFHKVMDLKPLLVKKGRSHRLIADAFHIFEAMTVTEAGKRLRFYTDRWQKKEPKAVRSLHRDFADCLTYLAYDDPIRTRLKTNNPIERYIQEIERRTVPMRSFTTVSSAERIIYGIIAYVIIHHTGMPKTEFTQ
jgi:transposase-like protein